MIYLNILVKTLQRLMDKDMGWNINKIKGAWLLTVWAFCLCISTTATARYAAVVMNAHTGQVIHQEHPDKVTHPASLTKMMTLYKVFQALKNGALSFNQELHVSQFAANQAPCKLGLRAGQTIKVKDAMMGMITKSANDAAVVLAEALGGTESKFAQHMTAEAKKLGMHHTHFKNASGLPNKQQVTTARDMAKLSQALIHHFPHYYGYFAAKDFQFKGQKHKNHNHLLGEVIGYGNGGPIVIDGIKTGFINASGFNLAASAKHDKQRLIGVVMGGDNRHWRDRRMKQLLVWGFGVEEDAPRIMNASMATGNAFMAPPPPPKFGKPAVGKKGKKATSASAQGKKSKGGKAKKQAKKKSTPKATKGKSKASNKGKKSKLKKKQPPKKTKKAGRKKTKGKGKKTKRKTQKTPSPAKKGKGKKK